MFEIPMNVPFTFTVSGTGTLTDATVFFHGTNSGLPVVTGAITGNAWSFSFTPPATGIYSLYAFGEIKAYATCVTKTTNSSIADATDACLGSWSWDKETGVLTSLRQNGSVLATHQMTENSTVTSKERVS